MIYGEIESRHRNWDFYSKSPYISMHSSKGQTGDSNLAGFFVSRNSLDLSIFFFLRTWIILYQDLPLSLSLSLSLSSIWIRSSRIQSKALARRAPFTLVRVAPVANARDLSSSFGICASFYSMIRTRYTYTWELRGRRVRARLRQDQSRAPSLKKLYTNVLSGLSYKTSRWDDENLKKKLEIPAPAVSFWFFCSKSSVNLPMGWKV